MCSASGTTGSRPTSLAVLILVALISLQSVDLEERTVEGLPQRCENCGTPLTAAEKEAILESGSSLVLCTTCSIEAAPLDVDEAEETGV